MKTGLSATRRERSISVDPALDRELRLLRERSKLEFLWTLGMRYRLGITVKCSLA